MSISHDETVVQGPVAYMQCALLYTSSSGERRIRWVALLGAHPQIYPCLRVLRAIRFKTSQLLLLACLECHCACGRLAAYSLHVLHI